MKQLILVRHAKSDWPINTSDFDRPLNKHRKSDCEVAAKYFNSLSDLFYFHTVISTSQRTHETWAAIEKHLECRPTKTYSEKMYQASVGDLLEVLQKQSKENIILVGHNPAIAGIGVMLSGERLESFPTLSIWHLKTEGEWGVDPAQTIARITARANPEIQDRD
ncbi:MAG: hypothetical protein RLZZ330_993 [Actinomycetota bacterium]|jgi:phosphohistidine phosphatase